MLCHAVLRCAMLCRAVLRRAMLYMLYPSSCLSVASCPDTSSRPGPAWHAGRSCALGTWQAFRATLLRLLLKWSPKTGGCGSDRGGNAIASARWLVAPALSSLPGVSGKPGPTFPFAVPSGSCGFWEVSTATARPDEAWETSALTSMTCSWALVRREHQCSARSTCGQDH